MIKAAATIAVIPARGGSKGVPRKNLRRIADKPLVVWAIEAARASRLIDRVVVSTEDEEIACVARDAGAEVPFMRPPALALDDSPEWRVWQHAIRMLDTPDSPMGVFVCVSPTAPLRAVEDIDACITMLAGSDVDLALTVTPAARNPYFNMVVLDENQVVTLASRPRAPFHRRQDAPEVFEMTTVAYAARPAFVLESDSWSDGRVKAVVVPRWRALDIDDELDLRMAEFLLGHEARSGADRMETAGDPRPERA